MSEWFLKVAKTRTGDQLHTVCCDDKGPVRGRTSCGCRLASIRPDGPIKVRPGLLCVKCFHPTLPLDRITNATFEGM